VAGKEYQAGAFHRFWLGTDYRPLWTAPIEAPILDLATFAGGLTPVRQVGQMQTAGLALRGADGRSYTFRSLHKEPERVLPPDWRHRWPGALVRDQTCATHPAAAVILPVLAEAAGVPHTSPRLVVMPDDPLLGKFRGKFAGQFGTIDEYPTPASDGYSGYMGATEIISTQRLWKRWLESPAGRVDTRAYLRARILDLLVENYDRHRGQWRWAVVPGKPLLEPIPEDPDMAFLRHEGLALAMLRGSLPKLVSFGPGFPGRLDGSTLNGSEVDRWVLTDLDRAAFDAIASDVRARVTDDVIERAARHMPPEWFAIDGARLIRDLRSRRDRLVPYIRRYYRYLADKVDIHATDRDEIFVIEHLPDGGVEVRIALAETPEQPYYRRRFDPGDTSAIRLYVHAGRNSVETRGAARGALRVRVLTEGDTTVDDRAVGHSHVWRDAGSLHVDRGPGTRVRQEAWVNPKPVSDAPWLEPRSWGDWRTFTPFVWVSPDVDYLLGGRLTTTTWGFRASPNARQQNVALAWSTGFDGGRLEYLGVFRRPASPLAIRLLLRGSQIEYPHFFGYGNETPEETSRARYRSRQKDLRIRATVVYERGSRFKASLGPSIEYSDTPLSGDTILAETAPYGVGRFGHVALTGGITFDSRKDASSEVGTVEESLLSAFGGESATGMRVSVEASATPPIWDARSTFGSAEGEVSGYLGSDRVTLATRVAGRLVVGHYPWFESASLGGRSDRGYRIRRFAGDASLYANNELRLWLGNLGTPLASLRVGAFGLFDVGRVWLRGEDSREWHSSYGGGVLVQPLGLPATVHFAVATEGRQRRFYYGWGYSF